MPQLIEIDELTRGDHSYLTPDDNCFFMGEYIARGGYRAGFTNDLILNLKKSPELRGTSQWPYKEWAIKTAADNLRAATDLKSLSGWTVVPIPPSKARDDVLYDDRICQVVHRFCAESPADPRELLYQITSLAAFHESPEPRDLARLIACMAVDERVASPAPQAIIVVDDVLTTGKHFRAAKTVLQRRFGSLPVVGMFIARRRIVQDEPDEP